MRLACLLAASQLLCLHLLLTAHPLTTASNVAAQPSAAQPPQTAQHPPDIPLQPADLLPPEPVFTDVQPASTGVQPLSRKARRLKQALHRTKGGVLSSFFTKGMSAPPLGIPAAELGVLAGLPLAPGALVVTLSQMHPGLRGFHAGAASCRQQFTNLRGNISKGSSDLGMSPPSTTPSGS